MKLLLSLTVLLALPVSSWAQSAHPNQTTQIKASETNAGKTPEVSDTDGDTTESSSFVEHTVTTKVIYNGCDPEVEGKNKCYIKSLTTRLCNFDSGPYAYCTNLRDSFIDRWPVTVVDQDLPKYEAAIVSYLCTMTFTPSAEQMAEPNTAKQAETWSKLYFSRQECLEHTFNYSTFDQFRQLQPQCTSSEDKPSCYEGKLKSIYGPAK
jgi:hypothetical protein